MDLPSLYRLIDLQPEMADRLARVGGALDMERLEPCLAQLLERDAAARGYEGLRTLLGEDAGGLGMLYCQLECARRAWERYRERGIGPAVYRDTMRCFPRFLAECRERNGRMFFDRGWWTYRQTSMRLFRLGTLEYELQERDGERSVAVHIPSDADLSPAAVDGSLDRADRFFRAQAPAYGEGGYSCHSWLLSPALTPLLSGDSRILAFQRRFRIVREDPGDREYIQWLFRVPEGTAAEAFPEGTSLQRGVKALVLGGGAVGSALGVMDRGRIWKGEGV